ncbi:MAG TPA: hypothetical protein VHU18_05765, partial [Rhizomicrobium sp.]|nr:hypothetical protein [Rhizomicrobium sp.]
MLNSLVFIGTRFRLKTPSFALDETHSPASVTLLPAGSVISVIKGPRPDDPVVRMLYDSKWLLMH